MGTTIAEILNALAADWLDRMLAVLWQSTLLIAAAALVALLLRRASPRIRFWLWQIVIVKLLLMPWWTLGVPLLDFTSPPAARSTSAIASSETSLPAAASPIMPVETNEPASPTHSIRRQPVASTHISASLTWPSWLMLGWMIIIIGQFARLAVQYVRLSRLLRCAIPADGDLVARTRRLSERLTLRRPPTVLVVESDCSVFVCGILRPLLVVPRNLLTLDSRELDQVILHELAHVRYHDLPAGWPVEIARIVYFFHPLVRWIRRRIWLERELACDQLAMNTCDAKPSEYIDTLIKVITRISSPECPAGTIAAGLDGGRPLDNGDPS